MEGPTHYNPYTRLFPLLQWLHYCLQANYHEAYSYFTNQLNTTNCANINQFHHLLNKPKELIYDYTLYVKTWDGGCCLHLPTTVPIHPPTLL